MARSIFDPTGGTPERSGTRFTPPDADPDFAVAGPVSKYTVASGNGKG